MTAIDYAKTLDFVTDIYLCGHSQGGLAITLAAAMEKDVVKAIIPLSPAYVIIKGANEGELLGQPFDPVHIPNEIVSWDERTLSGDYIRVAQSIDLEGAMRKYDGKVLLVHGDADATAPVQFSIDASKIFSDCRLELIKDDEHCYEKHLDKVVEVVKDFIQELLP